MRVLVAKEKHGSRYIACAPDDNAAAKFLIKERLSDTYDRSFRNGDQSSVWYESADADRARAVIASARPDAALRFLQARNSHEYESFKIVELEEPVI